MGEHLFGGRPMDSTLAPNGSSRADLDKLMSTHFRPVVQVVKHPWTSRHQSTTVEDLNQLVLNVTTQFMNDAISERHGTTLFDSSLHPPRRCG